MSRRGWILYDPTTSEIYTLPTNPNADNGSFNISKGSGYTLSGLSSYQDTSGNFRFGDTLIHQRPGEQRQFSFEGNVYSLSELEALETWVRKPRAVHLTDDLNRTFVVFFRELRPKRVRSNNHEKHSYTISGLVLREILEP
jgi:hypothetical protein